MSLNNRDENLENACVVCFKNVEIYSIGECDHPVCYECSTRMRVLCRQTECPICRQDMPKVIFTKKVKPFREIRCNSTFLTDRKFKIDFESTNIKQVYDDLLSHVCPICPERIAFQNFLLIKEHMRRSHELFYCELCVENLKILTRERRCYTHHELEQHRRYGDPDDQSHRGHPLCKFCDRRYMDKDELCRHLRRDHFFCHFCDADGYNQYYSSYDTLREHFRNEHYLCEEGPCYEEKFTSVFRSDIDLKAHRASVHGRTIGKAAAKQARTLELAFRLAPRPGSEYQRHNRGGVRNTRPHFTDEWDPDQDQGAVGGGKQEVNYHNYRERDLSAFTPINMDCVDEFPSLSGSNVNPQMTSGARMGPTNLQIRAAVQGGHQLAITDENFPALGPEATVSLRVNSSSERPKSTTGAVSKSQPTNFSIHVNRRPNSLTTRVTSLTTSGSIQGKEDFPALGGGSSAKLPQPIMQIASTQWSSGREPDCKVSLIKSKAYNHPPGKSKESFKIEKDNFPQLSSRFEAGCNLRPESKPKIPVTDPWVPLSRENGNISSDSDISGNRTGSKKKKKKSAGKYNNNSDEIQDKRFTESFKNNSNNSSNNNNNNNMEVKKRKQKSGLQSLDSTSTIERKRTELNVGKLYNGSQDKDSLDKSGGDMKHPGFIDILRDKPPPGFETTTNLNLPPPPGFSTIKINSIARPSYSNGLTFTSSSGQSYPIAPITSLLQSETRHRYIKPANFAPRNADLVEAVMKALNADRKLDSNSSDSAVQAGLNEFRVLSANFRQNELAANDYYNYCQKVMGSDFHDIFPELIVLLPDIGKQQELWSVHQTLNSRAELPKDVKKKRSLCLDVCTLCRQVLKVTDLGQHQADHSMENNFPSLNGNGLPSVSNCHK